MVFCYQNCSDLRREKNCSSDGEKLLNFEAEGQEFFKLFKSNGTIYSNSERQNNILTFSWSFLISNKLEQFEFKLEKKYWDLETFRKSWKILCIVNLYCEPFFK